MGYLCSSGEEVEGSGKVDLVDRVGFEFLLVLGKLVLVDFLQPPPIGLTVPRCSKSSRIFPASYPRQKGSSLV